MFGLFYRTPKQVEAPPPPPPEAHSPPLSGSFSVGSPAPNSEVTREGSFLDSYSLAEPLDSDESRNTLTKLVASVPPKILHQFFLDHLPTASPAELHHIGVFLDGLTPPETLHCARCHKSYVEVENGERACVMEHDDDSTEVGRAGWGKKGTEHQTTWKCCDEVVEGDGDQGPPSGWCFEGKHTTSRREARYRKDADANDDKLDSCKKRRCFAPVAPRKRSTRKRTKSTVAPASPDGEQAKKKRRLS